MHWHVRNKKQQKQMLLQQKINKKFKICTCVIYLFTFWSIVPIWFIITIYHYQLQITDLRITHVPTSTVKM